MGPRCRQKAAPGKGRDFLPADKQYLITRNGTTYEIWLRTVMLMFSFLVPCFRRATSLNYTDADEDAERLLSFLDEVRRLIIHCS